jgi:hypothetical protein
MDGKLILLLTNYKSENDVKIKKLLFLGTRLTKLEVPKNRYKIYLQLLGEVYNKYKKSFRKKKSKIKTKSI